MEKEKFNYKSKINYDDFVQYAKLNKNIKYGNFVKFELILLVLLVFQILLNHNYSTYILLLMFILLTLILYIVNKITLNGYITKLYNLLYMNEEEYEISFYNKYLIRKSKISNNNIEYSKISKIIETNKNFYIIYKTLYMCLKKDELSSDEQDFIRKIDIKKYKHKNDNINSDKVNIIFKIMFVVNIFLLLYLIYFITGSYSEKICYPVLIELFIFIIFLVIQVIANKKGYKLNKNIVASIMGIFLSLICIILNLSPKDIPIDYNNIYKYEKISLIKLPDKGRFYKGVNYHENSLSNYKYFKSIYYNEYATEIENEIKKSDKWLSTDNISSKLTIKNLNYNSGYYLIYNKSLNKYTNKIDKENDYEYCIMTYNKDTKYLIILEFKY